MHLEPQTLAWHVDLTRYTITIVYYQVQQLYTWQTKLEQIKNIIRISSRGTQDCLICFATSAKLHLPPRGVLCHQAVDMIGLYLC